MFSLTSFLTTLLVRRTVWCKCTASKVIRELHQADWRYGVWRTQIFTIYVEQSGVIVSGIQVYLLFTLDSPSSVKT